MTAQNISYNKAMTKTTVHVDGDFMESIWDNVVLKAQSKYVPPLFDEFTIINTHSNGLIETYYVKYTSATDWSITTFFGNNINNKKPKWILTMNVSYECIDIQNKHQIKIYANETINENNSSDFAIYSLDFVMAVQYYMQHFSPEIEYSTREVSELKRNEKSCRNGGYSQKIKLRSRKKQYIMNAETVTPTIMRKYRKITPCWTVRGYYQHYGKGNNRILKYIAPQIRYRTDMRNKKKPSNKQYYIEE